MAANRSYISTYFKVAMYSHKGLIEDKPRQHNLF